MSAHRSETIYGQHLFFEPGYNHNLKLRFLINYMVFKLSCNQITLSFKKMFGLLCNIAIATRYPQRCNINFHIHIYTCRQKNVYNLCYCILSTYSHQMLFQSPLSQQDQESELSQTQYLFAEINSDKIIV